LQIISALDWHPISNKIVSGSHDRNLFVWNFDRTVNKWVTETVIFSQKGGILDVKWSERGNLIKAICLYIISNSLSINL